MLSVVLVLYLASTVHAFHVKCNEQSIKGMTFKQSDDRVVGRYTAEFCTKVDPNVTLWTLDLLYNDLKHCNQTRYPGKTHSVSVNDNIYVRIKELNCTNFNVCLSTNFDMVFSSCYQLKSIIYKNGRESAPYDSIHNITNLYNFQYFNATAVVIPFYHEDYVTINFYPAPPPTNYVVTLCPGNDTSKGVMEECANVSGNCTAGEEGLGGAGVAGGAGKAGVTGAHVHCTLAPPRGCYTAWLRLDPSSWGAGVFRKQGEVRHDFCWLEAQNRGGNGTDDGTGGAAARAAAWAAAGAAAAAAALALALWRARAAATALHKRVLFYWRQHRDDMDSTSQARNPECKCILLLYARECEAGQRVAALLRALVQRAAGGRVQVCELYSAEAVARGAGRGGAGAGAEWVRACAARADVRVVLLQTPALALALALAGLQRRAEAQPLLRAGGGGGALYRAPHYGDALLRLALRLLADTAHQHRHCAYRKYYLATLSDIPTEIFPELVPFRRYNLPEATSVFLSDLISSPQASYEAPGEAPGEAPEAPTAPSGPPDQQEEFAKACAEFVKYVRDNPNYLADELIMT